MVSPGAPRLTQVHAERCRRQTDGRQRSGARARTAAVLRRRHANPISGNAPASPSPLTKEARAKRRGPPRLLGLADQFRGQVQTLRAGLFKSYRGAGFSPPGCRVASRSRAGSTGSLERGRTGRPGLSLHTDASPAAIGPPPSGARVTVTGAFPFTDTCRNARCSLLIRTQGYDAAARLRLELQALITSMNYCL